MFSYSSTILAKIKFSDRMGTGVSNMVLIYLLKRAQLVKYSRPIRCQKSNHGYDSASDTVSMGKLGTISLMLLVI